MHDLIGLVVAHGAWLVFGITFAARLGVPVPAAPLLVIAGALAVSGQGSGPVGAFATFVLAIVGNLLGDTAWFLAGRRHGYKVLRLLCRISISPDSCVRQGESIITRWGGASLIAAKFVPGVSVVAPPMAGALGMVFSAQIQQVLDLLSAMGVAALEALAVVLVLYLAWRTWRRHVFLRALAMARIDVAELWALLEGGCDPVVIDVRTHAGRALDARRIPGAIGVELDQIKQRAPGLLDRLGKRDREIVLYCNCPNEASAASAAQALAEAGFTRARPLAGGLDAWVAAGYRVDSFDPQI